MVEASPVVNTVIVALLAVAIVLIITKHYLASLCTSLISTLIIVVALVPCGETTVATGADGVQYAYTRNGAIKMKPKPNKVVEQHTPPTPASTTCATSPPVRASLGVARRPATALRHTNVLPSCNDPPPPMSDKEAKAHIRNHGLYGVRGNLNCSHMQRSSVADHGQLQPLNARNQMLKYLAFDQPHAKDPFLIPTKISPQ